MKRFFCALSFLALASISGANIYHPPAPSSFDPSLSPLVPVSPSASPDVPSGSPVAPQPSSLADYLHAITAYSGTKIVFDPSDLPDGKYHDIMTTLSHDRQLHAARIALREVHKYPKGYLGKVGIKAIGIFNACSSKHDDGYHTYDKTLKGY